MRRVRTVLAGIERLEMGRPWLAVPVAVVKKFGEDRAGSLAGLMAYYAFFSLFPLLLVLVTVLGIVLKNSPELQQRILDSALAQFPVIGDQLRQNTGSLDVSGFALVVGLGSALWAGTGVMKAAEDAMNDVWDVPMRERPNFITSLLRALLMLVVLGGGIAATAVLTGTMGSVDASLPIRVIGIVAGGGLNIGLVLLAFRFLTVRNIPVRQLLPGAVLAGVAWLGLQAAGGYLLEHQVAEASNTYGTFAVVIGLLWWLYLQAQVFLFAAELNVVLTNRLWPRSLTGVDSEADRRALRRHAAVEERAREETVDVRFRDDDSEAEGARASFTPEERRARTVHSR